METITQAVLTITQLNYSLHVVKDYNLPRILEVVCLHSTACRK